MSSDLHEAAELERSIAFLRGLMFRFTPKPKVLVVEDDANDLFFILREVSKFHCDVDSAGDGEEAVSKIESTKYDLILLDQMLPRLTGGEVLDKTSAIRQCSRVVMVTGLPGHPSVNRALDQGAVVVVPKPVTFNTLKLFLVPRYDRET